MGSVGFGPGSAWTDMMNVCLDQSQSCNLFTEHLMLLLQLRFSMCNGPFLTATRSLANLCRSILKCIYSRECTNSPSPPSHHPSVSWWLGPVLSRSGSLYVRTWNLPALVMYLMPLKGLYFSPYMSSRLTFSPVEGYK